MSKKKKEESSETDTAIKFLENTYKRKFYQDANKFTGLELSRVPFGVFPLDLAIGGGIPLGRSIMLWGKKSSGKTTLSLKAGANFQRTDMNTLIKSNSPENPFTVGYFDIEGSFDGAWASRMGLDLSKLKYERIEHGDECVDAIEAYIRFGLVDVLIVDSLAALVSTKRLQESAEFKQMGMHPKLVNEVCMATVSAQNHRWQDQQKDPSIQVPTVIFINQLREKIGKMYDSDYKPGGNSQDHAVSISIKLTATSVNESDNKISDNPHFDKMYSDTFYNFYVEKNKTHMAHVSGKFRMKNLNDAEGNRGYFYEAEDIVRAACNENIVGSKIGSWDIGELKFKTKTDLLESLKCSEEKRDYARKYLYEAISKSMI